MAREHRRLTLRERIAVVLAPALLVLEAGTGFVLIANIVAVAQRRPDPWALKGAVFSCLVTSLALLPCLRLLSRRSLLPWQQGRTLLRPTTDQLRRGRSPISAMKPPPARSVPPTRG